jgi:hypothetical protein
MRSPLLATLITAAAVLGGQRGALAQWDWNKVQSRGLFGERKLGGTIQPKSSTRFDNGFWRGPSGDFLGRDATRTGTMFPGPGPSNLYAPSRAPDISPAITSRGLEYRDPSFRQPQYPVQIVSGLPAATAATAGPPPVRPQPQAEEAPVISFREKSPAGEGTETALPAFNVPTVAAGPGIALSGVVPTLLGAGQPSAPLPFGLGQAGSIDVLMSNSLQSQIARMPRFQTGRPVQVSVSGGIATLQGAVPTQHDRKVLSEFVRMEPGIWNVDNQLTVEP